MDENNVNQDVGGQDAAPSVEGQEYQAPKVTFADTSKPEFHEELGEDNQLIGQEEQQQQQPQVNEPQGDEGGEDAGNQPTLKYEGNNQYLAAFEQWARQNGIPEEQLDFSNIDDSQFTEEHMNAAVGRIQAMKYLEGRDPTLHNLVAQGISIDDYIEQKSQINQYMALPDADLYKSQLYDQLVQQHQNMNTLVFDEQGNLSDQSQQMLVDEVEKYAGNLSPEQLKAKSDQIRAGLQQSMNQIPQHLAQRYQQQQQAAQESFNQQRKAYVDEVFKTIDKSKTLVTDFSGQPEKDEFKKFFDDMTSMQEVDSNGQKQMAVPLFHQLQNDSGMMLKVLRLLHLDKNGYFTDHKMSARKDAYNLLGLAPQVTKGAKGSKKNLNTYKGVEIEDTSQKEFWDRNQ